MNITPINHQQSLKQPYFKSQRKAGQTFADFEEYNKNFNITSQLQEIINDNNCVGEGRSNKVYKLPYTENFMLKAYKKLSPEYITEYQTKLTPVQDIFSKINIGQAIARMGSNILFLIKQDGIQHSIPYTQRENITQNNIIKYLSDIEKLSQMPEKAYINFTNEIKELTKHKCYIDYFNSNNLMLTDTEINIVDIVHIKNYKQRVFMFPSKESIIKILIDENILPIILPQLSEQQKIKLANSIKLIENKTMTAMQLSNLPENKFLTEILDFLSDNFHNGQNKRFKTALKSLK